MSAPALLRAVCAALVARGHAARLDLSGRDLRIAGAPAAIVLRNGRLRVCAALVFDGHQHRIPDGCGYSTVTPGSRFATIEKLVGAIETRLAARASSQPEPQDPSAITRDPEVGCAA